MFQIISWLKNTFYSSGFEKLTDAELVALAFTGDQLPKAWAGEVVARGGRLVPALSSILLDECNWHRGDAGWWAVVHATYLLGAIGGEQAVPILIHVMRLAEEWDNEWISHEIPSIFGRLGPKALPYLRKEALNRKADWYFRTNALEGMAAVTLRHPETEREVFTLVVAIASDASEDNETRAWAGRILLDFGKREHEPLLRSLLESGAAREVFNLDDLQSGMESPDYHCYNNAWLDFYDPENIAARRREGESGRLSEKEALEQAARAGWGTDPLEGDEASGEPQDEVRPPKNAQMITERMSFHASRAIKAKGLETDEEINAYLKSCIGKPPRPEAPQGAWEVGQDLMYEAWLEEDPGKRVETAHRALKICPDLADAYNLLAEETAGNLKEAGKLYEKALRAGERQLGPDFFAENAGRFWGIVETRPYMRARAGLAHCLWLERERDEAISHCYEMLRLNPHDNQGVRYALASYLSRLDRWQELEKLLERSEYKDDCGLEWLVMKALCAFVGEGASPRAGELLKDAVSHNDFLATYLLGDRQIPKDLPDYVALGSEEEAAFCAFEVLPAWKRVSGASNWLRDVLGLVVMPKAGRNELCPCGSGRKFKKCCLGKNPADR
ncbi:MAG: ST7 protein [Elusimicrobia bacterium]|nr:MAG: ST7 protein [Elusimicrobiota bacterium]KAF0155870.1 MAG: ST7 protein [Elusimicrobiota bacterium]